MVSAYGYIRVLSPGGLMHQVGHKWPMELSFIAQLATWGTKHKTYEPAEPDRARDVRLSERGV